MEPNKDTKMDHFMTGKSPQFTKLLCSLNHKGLKATIATTLILIKKRARRNGRTQKQPVGVVQHLLRRPF